MSQEQRVRLQKVLKTLHDMMIARQYIDDDIEWPSHQIVERIEDYEKLDMLLFHRRSDECVAIIFPNESKPGVTTIREIGMRMDAQKIQHAILILRGGLTPSARTELAELTRIRTESERRTAKRKRIEVFLEEELLFNITQHEWTPPHTLLSPQEKKQLMQRYKANEEQLPMIAANDPVVRFYGWRRGQVCRIERPCEASGTTFYYRMVA